MWNGCMLPTLVVGHRCLHSLPFQISSHYKASMAAQPELSQCCTFSPDEMANQCEPWKHMATHENIPDPEWFRVILPVRTTIASQATWTPRCQTLLARSGEDPPWQPYGSPMDPWNRVSQGWSQGTRCMHQFSCRVQLLPGRPGINTWLFK